MGASMYSARRNYLAETLIGLQGGMYAFGIVKHPRRVTLKGVRVFYRNCVTVFKI